MAYYINNVAAGDKYTDACTLGPFLDAKHAVVTVANNPALMQFAIGKQGSVRWTDEREFLSIPQSFKVSGICGVKFRNANPGQVARILAVLAGDEDPQFESGMPFTGALTATGGLGVSFLGVFTQAQWPPHGGSATQGDTAVLADTYGGVTFAWPLEYRPDIDPLLPWRVANGVAADYAIATQQNADGYFLLSAAGWVYTGNVINGGVAAAVVSVPVAGNWLAKATVGMYDQNAGGVVVGVGVSTTNNVQPGAGQFTTRNLAAGTSGRGSVEAAALPFNGLAKGASLYGWLDSTSAHVIVCPSFDIGIQPVKLANA